VLTKRTTRYLTRPGASGLILLGVICVPFAVSASAAPNRVRQARNGVVRVVRVLEAERTGVSSPEGLAFSRATGVLYVVARPPAGGSAPTTTDVVKLAPFELKPDSDRVGSSRVAAAARDPINIAFDDRRGRLLMLGNGGLLVEVGIGPDGSLDTGKLIRHSRRLGLRDPRGMSADPTSGEVFFLDASGPRIVRVQPAADGGFDGAVISEVDLRSTGVGDVRGLAFDPSTGHLHLRSEKKLYELTTAGQVVSVRDLSGLDLSNPQAMVFAPSGDQTDDPGATSVYLADSGSGQGTGGIAELSLAAAPAAAASTFTSSLVRTVDTAAYLPPSPDPSGLTYLPTSNTLLMTDGEVEETVNGITHFVNANVWETTLSGSVVRTANISKVAPTVTPMTNEPTGVTWQPSTGHYFFTDDGRLRVWNLNPGADQLIGTTDDSWTFFDTNVAGNGDPEGITYDTLNDHLFVADGVNAEVYEYTTAGVLVNHFDVLAYGVQDPETVEFNSVSGTLFTLSTARNGITPIIAETTTSGVLIQTIDVGASNAKKPAGLAYAPASNGSGEMRFYFVDRGVDNNADPNIVDGKMYELTAPHPLYFTLRVAATVGGVTAANEDVLLWDGTGFSVAFDGSDVGIGSLQIDAFGWLDADTLLLSFDADKAVPGIPGIVDDSDIVRFDATSLGANTAGSFSLYFDGSDVGLTAKGHDVDTVELLSDGRILLSTTASVTVGGVTARDEDLLAFTPSSLGDNTAGSFSLYFDGSDVGLGETGQDVDGVAVDASGRIYLSARAAFAVPGVSGQPADVFVFTPASLGRTTSGTYSPTPYFDGSAYGLDTNNVSALDLP
jgi:uncharacterized protein YjiK